MRQRSTQAQVTQAADMAVNLYTQAASRYAGAQLAGDTVELTLLALHCGQDRRLSSGQHTRPGRDEAWPGR